MNEREAGRERGAALMGAVLAVLVLSMLGTVSLNQAVLEIEGMTAARDEAVARHMAEAGSDLLMQWFHDPISAPGGPVSELFQKRFDLPEIGPSFFDASGRSQFSGTPDRPDLLFDARRPSDDRLMNDPKTGWFRSLRGLGRLLMLRVYGPTRPGLLCTVDVTAGTGRLTRTISVQLAARSIPPIRAGVQIARNGSDLASPTALPIWVHWGDLRVRGHVAAGRPEEIPVKTPLAPVTGQSYAEMPRREDRWAEWQVGGEVFYPPSATPRVPLNVSPGRDPHPGLQVDRWDYETLKQYALRYGTYYVRDGEGLLYRHGNLQPGLGVPPAQAFESEAVGDHRGLVFVDTLDQRPPHGENLGLVMLEPEYAEGLFVINAHVRFKPKGAGKPVPALSPPPEGNTSLARRVPVQLAGIHLQGVLYTAGDLIFEAAPRVYGAVAAGGRVIKAAENSQNLEVWYTYELKSGLVRGLPVVSVAPGTWHEPF